MAGLYVHIPFCKKRCLYCDFFSTTLLERRAEYVEALLKEIQARKNEAGEPIRTIYIGGGTPSTLEARDIQRILEVIGTDEAEEITMELNPGDATKEYLQAIRQAGVNRLSIGIQSFKDHVLRFIGRRHTAAQAIDSVHRAQEAGFDNISIDLMYALPTQTMNQWREDIQIALHMGVQHVSCYGLMYEEGTAMTKMRDRGMITPTDEEAENEMYDYLCEHLKNAGFVHYEVSNFALPGYESKHNSRYWDRTPYLGVGAAAHSFDGEYRRWNVADVKQYVDSVAAGHIAHEEEQLGLKDAHNEYLMTALRTVEGIAKDKVMQPFAARLAKEVQKFVDAGWVEETPTHYRPTADGLLHADGMAAELFIN